MTDPALLERARNAGIATSYENWRHESVAVPEETLAAILAVLETGTAEPTASGGAAADDEPTTTRLMLPREREHGLTVQLYSVRSRQSWGHGDLRDLGELARWSASQFGAGFVLVNPLHAAEPLPPISPSPYLPMTRLFTSPLYLNVAGIAEYGQLSGTDKERIARLAEPLRKTNTTAGLIDRNEVWRAKRAALELISNVPLSPQRQAEFARFRLERGSDLDNWTAWCALAERHGPDWRSWPASLRSVGGGMAALRDERLRRSADFHAWLQWHADEQLAEAQQQAKAAGMAHGIIHDLAVGVHPGGADAWAHQDLLVPGFSVGAPPDGFNQQGQDWAQPPWHPGRLAEERYRPLAHLFGTALAHSGGLRVDHVMGLMRLWWVPAGQPPDRGAYVRYDHRASVAALANETVRARAVAIGEDLGTVDEWIRSYLADHGILGTMMLWFATGTDGTPLPPGRWRRRSMATVGTHDLPTVAGFVTGDQVAVRARLGLLRVPEERERADERSMLSRWRAALEHEGLLAAGRPAGPDAFTVACYGYLARTPAVLVGVSLADAVGDVRTQNIPGTSDEYANWQIPLCDGNQNSVLIEDLPGVPLLRDVCEAASRGMRHGGMTAGG
jgi:4-alpha-glucanotransferase